MAANRPQDGIGMFIWSTDSQQDMALEDESGETRFMNLILGTFANGSAVVP